MNERIKKLVEQSFIITTDGKIGHVSNYMVEKFAELIVRDVLDEVLQAMDDGMDVYDTVADKFGVEE